MVVAGRGYVGRHERHAQSQCDRTVARQLRSIAVTLQAGHGEQQLTPLYIHPSPGAASLAASDVLTERYRQIQEEEWSPEHDDNYTRGELAVAAAAYATAAHWHAIGHHWDMPPAFTRWLP
ncbi:hypothetical protein [Azotobacter armeniacus]